MNLMFSTHNFSFNFSSLYQVETSVYQELNPKATITSATSEATEVATALSCKARVVEVQGTRSAAAAHEAGTMMAEESIVTAERA